MKEGRFRQYCEGETRFAIAILIWGVLGGGLAMLAYWYGGAFYYGIATSLSIVSFAQIWEGVRLFRAYQWSEDLEASAEAILSTEKARIGKFRQMEILVFSAGVIWMLIALIFNLGSYNVGFGIAIMTSTGVGLIWWLIRQWKLSIYLGES